MLDFDYLEPTSLEQAATALSEREVAAKVFAGGTDIIVQIKEGRLAADLLVSLAKIPGLRSVDRDGKRIALGAMTTIGEIETSSLIRQSIPILCDAVDEFGSVQTRNVATLGGNLCNASPAADCAPALLALRAAATVWTAGRPERRNLQQFFTGPGRTILERGDILTSIDFDMPPPRSGGAYLKFASRNAMDLPIVSIGVQLQMDSDFAHCVDVTIALGAAAPTPIRVAGAEQILRGERLGDDVLTRAANRAAEEARPRDDFRASAGYRKAMIRNLLPEVVRRAIARTRLWTG